MAKLQITSTIIKQTGSETFYCYGIGDDYKMWFTQHANGHIYSVSLCAKDGVKDDLEFYIGTAGMRDKVPAYMEFYPTKFEFRAYSGAMTADDADDVIRRLKLGQKLLRFVKELLYSEQHFGKLCKCLVREQLEKAVAADMYDMRGVEFTDEDIDAMAQRVMNSELPVDVVVDYLRNIREMLD